MLDEAGHAGNRRRRFERSVQRNKQGRMAYGRLTSRLLGRLLILAMVPALAACESSSRLGSLMPASRPPQRPIVQPQPTAPPPPLVAAPDEDVESSELPPAGGAPPPIVSQPGQPPVPQTAQPGVGTAPGNLPPLRPTAPPPDQPALGTPRIAAAPPAAPAANPSRSNLTGNWSLQEAAGNRCRITLSSAPKLDLYAAGTAGCQSRDLQRVNAWELAGSEVILYEPGGDVAARLRPTGAGYAGVTAKSGAPITLSK